MKKDSAEKKLIKLYLSGLDKYFTLSKNVLNQIKKISKKSKGINLFHPLLKEVWDKRR